MRASQVHLLNGRRCFPSKMVCILPRNSFGPVRPGCSLLLDQTRLSALGGEHHSTWQSFGRAHTQPESSNVPAASSYSTTVTAPYMITSTEERSISDGMGVAMLPCFVSEPAASLAGIVNGAASVRGAAKPDMQDRHMVLPGIAKHVKSLQRDPHTFPHRRVEARHRIHPSDTSSYSSMDFDELPDKYINDGEGVVPMPPPNFSPISQSPPSALQHYAGLTMTGNGVYNSHAVPQGSNNHATYADRLAVSWKSDASDMFNDYNGVTPTPARTPHVAACALSSLDVEEEVKEVAHPLLCMPTNFTAVFDGHSGCKTAKTCADRLWQILADDPSLWACFDSNTSGRPLTPEAVARVSAAVTRAFLQMDHEILEVDRFKPPGEFDGATALIGLQLGADLVVANCGDTRAVLCRGRRALRVSKDHTPDLPEERERIERQGGYVRMYKGTWRLVLPIGPNGGLKICAVSRAIGDIDYKEPRELISAQPDVSYIRLQPGNDSFVIYATDGLWCAMTDEQAVDLVQAVLDEVSPDLPPQNVAHMAAAALVDAALARGSGDDITAVVSILKWDNRL